MRSKRLASSSSSRSADGSPDRWWTISPAFSGVTCRQASQSAYVSTRCRGADQEVVDVHRGDPLVIPRDVYSQAAFGLLAGTDLRLRSGILAGPAPVECDQDGAGP
jgi:hypothetical protein